MSQTIKILNTLLSGESLTALDALGRFGTLRLAARINDIKKLGYDVKMKTIPTKSGKKVAQYTLEKP